MKRLHIHVSVDDLFQSIRFYSALFGREPTKQRSDYAQWKLDDPKVNFAISARGAEAGIDHLGIQVEEAGELEEVRARLKKADLATFAEGETTCCYARSDKTWVKDPSGLAWEAYQTMAEAEFFNEADVNAAACCAPDMARAETPVKSGCC
jgi:catechol 2,3-dioxygenase-like lactoylglutathione lyase family enzyme